MSTNERTFKVPAHRSNDIPWGEPVIEVCRGYEITITASGRAKHNADSVQGMSPAGFPNSPGNSNSIAPGLPQVALVGKVGNSAPFLVGNKTTYTATENGKLYLTMNSFTWSFEDNSGEWDVTISGEGLPEAGWTHVRALESPKIKIMGTEAVSDSALDVVETIYEGMTSRIKAPKDKSLFDGFKVYITNGEPWTELSSVAPIGTMWSGTSNGIDKGDDLRGGSNSQYLWISEQMICKTGVKTRNDSFAAGNRTEGDTSVRTYDQVVHELAHSIARKYSLDAKITEIYGGDEEAYAWSVQHWFSSPSGTLTDAQRGLMEEIFTSQTSFSTDLYTTEAEASA